LHKARMRLRGYLRARVTHPRRVAKVLATVAGQVNYDSVGAA
jgi:hypothetical protein